MSENTITNNNLLKVRMFQKMDNNTKFRVVELDVYTTLLKIIDKY
jgi:hypothetical protein